MLHKIFSVLFMVSCLLLSSCWYTVVYRSFESSQMIEQNEWMINPLLAGFWGAKPKEFERNWGYPPNEHYFFNPSVQVTINRSIDSLLSHNEKHDIYLDSLCLKFPGFDSSFVINNFVKMEMNLGEPKRPGWNWFKFTNDSIYIPPEIKIVKSIVYGRLWNKDEGTISFSAKVDLFFGDYKYKIMTMD